MHRSKSRRIGPITLRNIPPELARIIRQRADEANLSLNRTVIRLLEESVMGPPGKRRPVYHDLDHLFGTWTAEEAADFDRELAHQRRIDPEMWK